MLAEAKTLTMVVDHPKEAPPDRWFTLHGEPVGVSSTSWELPMLAGLQNQRPPPKGPLRTWYLPTSGVAAKWELVLLRSQIKEAGYTFSGSYGDCAAGSLSASKEPNTVFTAAGPPFGRVRCETLYSPPRAANRVSHFAFGR